MAGNVTGDIYSDTGVLVLDNGIGGVSTSNFYGTSSYASNSDESLHALTSDMADAADIAGSLAPGFPYTTPTTLDLILIPTTNHSVVYRHDHGLGTVPSLVQVKIYVSDTWTTYTSFIQGDELDVNVLMIGDGVFDACPIWIKYDATSVYITYNAYVNNTITVATRMRTLPNSLPLNNQSTAFGYPGWIDGESIQWDKLKYKIYVWK